jgi:hypothetical protein
LPEVDFINISPEKPVLLILLPAGSMHKIGVKRSKDAEMERKTALQRKG